MPLTAKTTPNSDLAVGETNFHFGEDGTRQVTQNEAEMLRQYADNGGVRVVISETEKTTKARKRDLEE